LPRGLLDLVIERLPIRFSFIAALARVSADWVVFVWEIAVAPDGSTQEIHAELVSEILLRFPDWEEMTAANPHFVAGSETLVTPILDYEESKTIFWDVRRGSELVTVEGADIMAVSDGGGAAIGNAHFWGHPGVWNMRTGERIPQVLEPLDPDVPQCGCTAAEFAPAGDIVAALLEASVFPFDDLEADLPLWSVIIFNSSSGEKVCDFIAPPGEEVDQIPALSFHFDGKQIAICNGLGEDGMRFDVRWREGGCELVRNDLHDPCDDVFLPGGLRLELGTKEARIIRGGGGDTDEVIDRAALEGLGDVGLVQGFFSPDGRKAFVCCADICYVWAFADGRGPVRIETELSDIAFAADSSSIAGITEDSAEVMCFGLDGRLALRLGANVDEMTGLAVGEVLSW